MVTYISDSIVFSIPHVHVHVTAKIYRPEVCCCHKSYTGWTTLKSCVLVHSWLMRSNLLQSIPSKTVWITNPMARLELINMCTVQSTDKHEYMYTYDEELRTSQQNTAASFQINIHLYKYNVYLDSSRVLHTDCYWNSTGLYLH